MFDEINKITSETTNDEIEKILANLGVLSMSGISKAVEIIREYRAMMVEVNSYYQGLFANLEHPSIRDAVTFMELTKARNRHIESLSLSQYSKLKELLPDD